MTVRGTTEAPGPPPSTVTRQRTTSVRAASLAILLLLPNLLIIPAEALDKKGLKLNDFISHYEPAFFSISDVANQHKRRKRAITSTNKPDVAFNFTAHNRLFQLELNRDASEVFAEDIEFVNSNGPIHYDSQKIYKGVLADTPGSSVQGILTDDGLFDGHISTSQEHFYVEPADRYFPADSARDFHSVIYKSSDVSHPGAPFDHLGTPCKSHELHLKRKESFTKSNKPSVISPRVKREDGGGSLEDVFFENLSKALQEGPKSMEKGKNGAKAEKQTVTTYEIVDWADVPESVRHHFRKKANQKKKIDKKKKTCMLYLQADHLFFKQMGSEEASIDVMTRHVQRVNSIYREIDFDQDGKPDNITFMIKRIKVYTPDALKDKKYRFPGNYGVEKFLEIFSEENYDAFCLAYMFTYRDFEGGTLGLAWTGDLKNAGGVCERNGHYRGSLKSLNTGIITLLNYGKHVPPAVSHVTMAHEMGHNFGSPHDPENNKVCVPGGEDGNYIMFARATSGDKSNNRKFSPCSLKSVQQVLTAKARGPKGCFIEPKQALCGNGVVEEGEECDCGWEEDCEEECCWPQKTKFPPGQKPCTLRPQKVCSPTQGPCCTDTCQFKLGDKCREDNGCRAESFCDGSEPTCPMSELMPNKTVCNEEFVCYKGECTGSICLAYGMESCQCTQGPGDADTKACELCCKEPGENKPCLSSFELNEPPFDMPDMISKPGTPCNNYQGYCDVFQKCREVDPSGPLATLRKILLSEESIASLQRFLTTHWYIVIFLILGVFALMIVIIRFCGKKTPLVRRKRRHRHTVHHDSPSHALKGDGGGGSQQQTPEVQVHPTAVEAAVPFGKKVRLGEGKKKKGDKDKKKDKNIKYVDDDDWKSTTNEAVSRATRLAANLGSLIVNLPPEGQTQSSSTPKSSPEKTSEQATTQGKSTPKSSAEEKAKRKRREGQKRSRSAHKRHSKSLSPEKTIAAGVRRSKQLAESVTSISKSFEKLDIIGQKKRKRREHERRKRAASKSRTRAASADKSKKKEKEMTIAKLGPFKFSVEMKQDEKTQNEAAKQKAKEVDRVKKERKKSAPAGLHLNIDKQLPQYQKVSSSPSRAKAESPKTAPPGTQQPSFADKTAAEAQSPPSTAPVIVSKKHQGDRPLRSRPQTESEKAARRKSEKIARADQEALLKLFSSDTDYRLGFSRPLSESAEKFPRSVSYPEGVPEQEASFLPSSSKAMHNRPQRKYSFANEKRPELEKLYQLKRSTSAIHEEPSSFNRLGQTKNESLLLATASQRKRSTGNIATTQAEVNASERFSRLSSLKKQLQSQWDQAGANLTDGTKSLNSTFRRRNKNKRYDAIDGKESTPDDDDDDEDDEYDGSDTSSDYSKQRLSPPTQVQSLSEETSSADGRSSSKVASPNYFDSEDDSDLEEVVLTTKQSSSSSSSEEAISRKKILAAAAAASSSGAAGGSSGSRSHLLPSSGSSSLASSTSNSSLSKTDSEEEEEDEVVLPMGCEKLAEDNAHESLDYVKRYGEVPRLLQGKSPRRNLEEGDEDESESILNEETH